MKRELRKLGKKILLNSNNYALRESFHKLKKEYNKTLKQTKHNFLKEIVSKWDSLHENDPKLFW